MSQEQSNWKPSASLETLNSRAKFLHNIRSFFADRSIIEVDTPLLCQSTVTDPYLESFTIKSNDAQGDRYLQTSPEYAMKRILAVGSGAIYYLGKAFRKHEIGCRHNPEFTLLEWYRPGWDHLQLIKEVDDLLQTLLGCPPAKMTTYQTLFEEYVGVNPHLATAEGLKSLAQKNNNINSHIVCSLDKDGLLDLLMTHCIEHHLGKDEPLVVLDYPASQASLAKTSRKGEDSSFEVAERFEFYYQGIELANGYHELLCEKELKERFDSDLIKRQTLGLCKLPLDNFLLDALSSGFPSCAGVAVGVDRLLMLKLNERNISHVIPFAWERA